MRQLGQVDQRRLVSLNDGSLFIISRAFFCKEVLAKTLDFVLIFISIKVNTDIFKNFSTNDARM